MHVRLLALLLVSSVGLAQPRRPLFLRSEAGSYFSSSGQTPFWLRSNQYGVVPREPAILTLRQSIRRDYHPRPTSQIDSLWAAHRRFDWGWGGEVVVNAGYNYRVLIPEAYVKVRRGALELWGGRRREIVGLVDTLLSSGAYIQSGNALPLWKVQLGLPDFTYLNRWLAVKGFYAHGWFEADRFVRHTLLHQKAFYIRIGTRAGHLRLYAGANHQVMWGGETERLSNGLIKNNRLPGTLRDYVDVVTATTLGNRTDVDTSRISVFDRENRIGNHLGTVDLGVEYVGRTFSIMAYRQNVYEDGSLMYLTNIRDGLNGLRIRNRRPLNPYGLQIQDVLVEYLYTISQGGAVFSDYYLDRGRDNYFNHSQYQDGWSRYGMTIGTPFITPSTDSRPELPRYGFTNNNRVAVLHLGVAGQLLNFFQFQLRASYSENLGTYEVPFPRPVRQFSSALHLSSPLYILDGVTAHTAIAADFGGLFPNSVGVYVGIRKDVKRQRKR